MNKIKVMVLARCFTASLLSVLLSPTLIAGIATFEVRFEGQVMDGRHVCGGSQTSVRGRNPVRCYIGASSTGRQGR